MKRYASFALALLLVLSIGVVPARAEANSGAVRPAETVTEGGVEYYRITDIGQLIYIAETRGDWLSKNYRLEKDLVFNDKTFQWDEYGNLTLTDAEKTGLNVWTPIGYDEASTYHSPYDGSKFTGIFDGCGHSISGLYIDKPLISYQGLFGYVGNGGAVRNVRVINSHIYGKAMVGGVVGRSDGNIEDCSFDGMVKGCGVSVGGIVGETAARLRGGGRGSGCQHG